MPDTLNAPQEAADDSQGGKALCVSPQDPKNYINDKMFCDNLKRLRDLREFLIDEAVAMERIGCLSLRELNQIRDEYRPNGRDPTREEWNQLEVATNESFRVLPEAVRRSFLMRKPPWWVSYAQVLLILLALVSLVFAYFIHDPKPSADNVADARFPLYLIWSVSLGAVGALAFLGMNALSIQSDATFDITNTRLLIMRIVLGGLFGLIFALPLGYAAFIEFLNHLCSKKHETFKVEYIILLLAPFVIGFSTTLVITIMNRLIEGVQAIFGRPNSGETSATRLRNTTTGTSEAARSDAGAAASPR